MARSATSVTSVAGLVGAMLGPDGGGDDANGGFEQGAWLVTPCVSG